MPSIPFSLLPFGLEAGGGAGMDTGASLASMYAGEYDCRATGVWF